MSFLPLVKDNLIFSRITANHFSVKYDMSCGFFIDALFQVGKVSLYSSFVLCFIEGGFWTLSNAYSVPIEMIILFFFLSLFYKSECTTLIFHMLNQILFPGISPIWSWYIMLFWFGNLVHFVSILLCFLHLCSAETLVCSFLVVSLLSLGFRVFAVVQLVSCVWLFLTPWTAAHQASLSLTIS